MASRGATSRSDRDHTLRTRCPRPTSPPAQKVGSLSHPSLSSPDAVFLWFMERQTPFDSHLYAVSGTLYSGRTRHQRVEILDTPQFGKLLVLDGDPQSFQSDEPLYHEVLVHPAMLAHENPVRVLILGGGEGATLREVLKHRTVRQAVMVDLDEELVALCRRYLPELGGDAFEDARAEVLFQDAVEYLRNNRSPFDVIISDLTEPLPDSPTHLLYNRAFFDLAARNLSPNGIFVMQASRVTLDRNSLHLDHHRFLANVFPVVRPFHVFIPSFFSDWGFLAASREQDPGRLSPAEVDGRLGERLIAPLAHYDGETHQGLMALPRDLRRALQGGKTSSVL